MRTLLLAASALSLALVAAAPNSLDDAYSVAGAMRANISPNEFRGLKERQLVVTVPGAQTVIAEKFRYYEDEVFAGWARLPPA